METLPALAGSVGRQRWPAALVGSVDRQRWSAALIGSDV